MMQGQRDLITVGRILLSELAPLVNAHQGVMYIMDSDERQAPLLKQLAGYADATGDGRPRRYRIGEGLVGQCALERERVLLGDIGNESIRIVSGLAEVRPRQVLVIPVLFEGQVKAVIELASLQEFTESHLAFLDQLTGSIGIVLNTIEATMRTEGLLDQSQQLAGELQTQQKELQQTNEELAQKAKLLAEQNAEVERKNQEIEQARRALEEKAAELALTSRYKSEFLANMSHELRTPLNSILILGQQLSDNPEKNLSGKQIEYAKTIHGAGTDLLNLISDILDLSKIESGTVTVENEELPFAKLRDTIDRSFRHEAESRKLAFSLDFDPNLGRALNTDPKRLLQVLKNLLSNAFKFTGQGGVRLRVAMAKHGWTSDHPVLAHGARRRRAFGQRHRHRHSAGQTEDHLRSVPAGRRRHLAQIRRHRSRSRDQPRTGRAARRRNPSEQRRRTGQHVHAVSAAQLRRQGQRAGDVPRARHLADPAAPRSAADDRRADRRRPRRRSNTGDSVLLIVEDDPHYARILLDLARQRGFKALVATRGSDALILAQEFLPTAISLDIALPDMLGWTVLSRLKQNPSTRHIPVQIVTVEEEHHQGLERGAFAYVNKPATTESLEEALERIKRFSIPRTRNLLVIEDNDAERMSICELIAHDDVAITTSRNGAEALAALEAQKFDCAVLDLRLPDTSGLQLMQEMQKHPNMRDVPIVVYTGKELSHDDETELRKIAKSIVLKDVRSPERLLDETALFLHRVVGTLPPHKQQMLERLHQSDEALVGKKVLVIDDDVRNIFALSSLLERHGINVLTATGGAEAIELIDKTPDVALVLVDIMMPQMDGYQTIKLIRERPMFRLLPMIALTAKAMKGDREKCLEAGASDYIAKPVNSEQLLSLLRIWLHR